MLRRLQAERSVEQPEIVLKKRRISEAATNGQRMYNNGKSNEPKNQGAPQGQNRMKRSEEQWADAVIDGVDWTVS